MRILPIYLTATKSKFVLQKMNFYLPFGKIASEVFTLKLHESASKNNKIYAILKFNFKSA